MRNFKRYDVKMYAKGKVLNVSFRRLFKIFRYEFTILRLENPRRIYGGARTDTFRTAEQNKEHSAT